MKKKSLLAIGLSLSMMLAMATPAFAANTDTNVNVDGTLVTAPGNPDYNKNGGGNTQTAGQSYNESNMTNTGGTKWETANDDDAVAKANDTTADINVWAQVKASDTKVYKVDLAWGVMKFQCENVGEWDPDTHQYNKMSTKPAVWTTSYLDGKNNKVAVTNHSNNAIDATFAYTMDTTNKFNDANGVNNVIGNFFDTKEKAAAAATVLTNTYSNATGTVNDAAVADKLAGSKVALATAAAYNDGTNNQPVGARTDDVFFAFSGTPDPGKSATLDTFKKVGVITVTVTPNVEAGLN